MEISHLIVRTLILWLLSLSILLSAQAQRINIPEPIPPPVHVVEHFGLDTSFYKQWIDVEGYPVLASANTSPYAVKEAAYLIYKMVGHRPDMLRAMGENGSRFLIMAWNEMISEIPEYSDMRVVYYWHDIRGRGLGGSNASTSEENLLGYPNTVFPKGSILIHEFAHAVHRAGMSLVDPGFDARLESLYRAAMEKGLYDGMYAEGNRDEYWAEGTNAWFNSETPMPLDAPVDVEDTREALKMYDPGLAALLTEIHGDSDWRFTPVATRTHQPHLQGFDPQNTPTYQDPPETVALAKEFTRNLESTGDGRWVNLERYPLSELQRLQAERRQGAPTIIFFGNYGTDDYLSIYRIAPDGTELYAGRVRHDMKNYNTHVGSLWLVKDEAGKVLGIYRAEAKVSRVLIIKELEGAGPKIEGPWLWMIAPTQHGLQGSEAAASGKDYLAIASKGSVTEKQIATKGATLGDKVGDKVWTLGKLAPTGKDNITETVNTIGLTNRDYIEYHVAYGSISLDSPRKQNTRMHVGSDDAVKVWLNGKLVHNKPVDRGADNYKEVFSVTLKKGKNILLIAVYQGWADWSGFFGFANDAKYSLLKQNPDMESDIEVVLPEPADINEDGRINAVDLLLVVAALTADTPTNPRTDVNGDGTVNVADLLVVIENLDDPVSAAAPMSIETATLLDRAKLEAQLNILHAENDRTLKYQRAIAFLQNLLSVSRPDQTRLLANYPNPFNPETWIPYELAKATEVWILIYDASGTVVRRLALGHQPAGYHTSRSRAAYWDGKNEVGETVASGVYFYTLETGEFTATRKMLIRK